MLRLSSLVNTQSEHLLNDLDLKVLAKMQLF